jgi:hypothetical protein
MLFNWIPSKRCSSEVQYNFKQGVTQHIYSLCSCAGIHDSSHEIYEFAIVFSHNGKIMFVPNFPLQQEATNDWLPTHLLRMNVCGLLNTVANSNNDRLIYITNSLFAAYFSMCHPSLTFHFPSFSQCIQNESSFSFSVPESFIFHSYY